MARDRGKRWESPCTATQDMRKHGHATIAETPPVNVPDTIRGDNR